MNSCYDGIMEKITLLNPKWCIHKDTGAWAHLLTHPHIDMHVDLQDMCNHGDPRVQRETWEFSYDLILSGSVLSQELDSMIQMGSFQLGVFY